MKQVTKIVFGLVLGAAIPGLAWASVRLFSGPFQHDPALPTRGLKQAVFLVVSTTALTIVCAWLLKKHISTFCTGIAGAIMAWMLFGQWDQTNDDIVVLTMFFIFLLVWIVPHLSDDSQKEWAGSE